MRTRATEETAIQAAAVAAVRQTLASRLEELAHSAAAAAKVARRRGRHEIDLNEVYADVNHVRRVEEALDLSLLDLATAGGEDA